MSKVVEKKDWSKWSPKKIFVKDIKDNYKDFLYNKKIIEKKLYTDLEYQKNFTKNIEKIYINEIQMKHEKEQAYQKGFKIGYEECKKNEKILQDQIKKILIDFENSTSLLCDNVLFYHLLQVILKVSSYVIGKNINFNKDDLLKNIKNIIRQDNIVLKNPKLIVNPQNKNIVENLFLDSLNIYNWKLVYDKNIDIYSCKVISDSGDIDATMNTRWKELCQLVHLGEY